MTIKLEGIFEQVLGGYPCIRGYARLGDLAKCSAPNSEYQRDLINSHEKEIADFLSDREFLFFPEVILACSITYDFEKKGAISGLNPLRDIQEKKSFVSNKDGLSIRFRFRNAKNSDTRNRAPYSTLSFEESRLKLERIDGNHRLSACDKLLEKNPSFADYITPFCILIFPDPTLDPQGNAYHSKAIFHNINYKHIRLTMEQSLKLILEDETLFSNEKLEKKFGQEYLVARQVWKKAQADDFKGIPHFDASEPSPRTAAHDLGKFIKECDHAASAGEISQAIIEAGKHYRSIFNNRPCSLALMVCAVYYALQSRPKLEQFLGWASRNHIHHIKDTPDKRGVTPESLKEVYECVREARNKTIFVSMPFGKDDCDSQYAAIEDVVKAINREHDLELSLKAYRIDSDAKGHSFQITDQILKDIKEVGMLIANLSHHRANVYHEVGYAMGLAEAMGETNKVLLIVHKDSKSDIAFNLQSFKQIRFGTDLELKKEIKAEIEAQYGLK